MISFKLLAIIKDQTAFQMTTFSSEFGIEMVIPAKNSLGLTKRKNLLLKNDFIFVHLS